MGRIKLKQPRLGTKVIVFGFVLILVASSLISLFQGTVHAAGETYSLTSATAVQSSGGNLGSETFNGGGGQFTYNVICMLSQKTGASGEVQYSITLGSKISTGGYNATIKTTVSGLNCGNPTKLNGNITVSDPNGVGPNGGSKSTAATTASAGNTSTPGLSCNAGFNPLNWLLCAAVSGMVAIANTLDNLVNSELAIGTTESNNNNGAPTGIFGPCTAGQNPCPATGYKTAWASFRDIALAILVVVALIVVISTALGVEILDAYTIRKILPRLVVMAIVISLSWNIMEFVITLTNDIGYGVRYLIYQPFATLKLTIGIGGGNGAAVDLIGAAGITALGIFGLLLFATSAAISVAAGLVMLILRQVLAVACVIISPLAFVCNILPNTQQYYSEWSKLTFRLLLLGAIFQAIIAIGHVAAALTDQGNNPVDQIAALVMYFGAYLLIFTKGWQYGGTGMQMIGNAITHGTKGVQDSIHKKQSENVSNNIAKARAGQRWNEQFGKFKNPFTGKQTSIGHLANRGAVNLFDQDELVRYRAGKYGVPGFKHYNALINDQLDDAAAAQSIEGYKHIESEGGLHYQAWRALTGTGMADFEGTAGEGGPLIRELLKQKGAEKGMGFYNKKTKQWRAPQSLDELKAVSEIMMQSTNDKERLGGVDLENSAGYLAQIKSDPKMAYANLQAMGLIGLSAEGRAEPEQLATAVNSISSNTTDGVGQRILKQAQKVGSGKRPDIRQGHGIAAYTTEEGGKHVVRYSSVYTKNPDPNNPNAPVPVNNYQSTADTSILSIKSNEWAGAKAETLDAMRPDIMRIATYGSRPGERNPTKLGQARQLQQMIEYQQSQFGPSEADARRRWAEMHEEILSTLNPAGQTPTGPLEDLRENRPVDPRAVTPPGSTPGATPGQPPNIGGTPGGLGGNPGGL